MVRDNAVAVRDDQCTAQIALLERILRAQLEGHIRLLSCIERNREAIRIADMEAITTICQQENEIAQRLSELEKARLELVGQLTEVLQPDAKAPLTVSQIVQAIDEPARASLCAAADELRGKMAEVRKASSIVHAAAESLSRHMAGLMQTVQAAISRAEVYGSGGRIAGPTHYQFAVDLTT